MVFPQRPTGVSPQSAPRGRPQTRRRLAEGSPPPIALRDLARQVRLRRVTWREGTQGKLAGRFAWLRVWPGHGWQQGACAHATPVWLLIEEQGDGKVKFAFSNLPPGTRCRTAVRLWKSRWPVEH